MQINPLKESEKWSALEDLPITASAAVGKVTVSYRTNGSFVEVYAANGAYTSNSEVAVATLPAGLGPVTTMFIGLTESSTGYLRIQHNGSILLKCPDAYGRAYTIYSCL